MFDYSRLRLRIERAHRVSAPDAGFLSELAAKEIAGRLAVTNRNFENAIDLFSPTDDLTRLLKTDRPEITVKQLSDENRRHDRDVLSQPAESFDLAVSIFGLHWCNDLPGTLMQISNLLVPDGLFMAVIPGHGTLQELHQSILATESQISGGATMRVDPFAEIKQVGSLLQRVGLALPVVDSEEYVLRYRDVQSLVLELRSMAATCSLAGKRPALPRDFLDRLEGEYRSKFSDEDGKIRATVNLIYMTAWKPHESQQKPLKPGSAGERLANALKT
ncbi:MAG: methyltransferase domain-containing protein [Rhizobiaceae bacterium]